MGQLDLSLLSHQCVKELTWQFCFQCQRTYGSEPRDKMEAPCIGGYKLRCQHAYCHGCIDSVLDREMAPKHEPAELNLDDHPDFSLDQSMSTTASPFSTPERKFSFQNVVDQSAWGRFLCVMCNRHQDIFIKHYMQAKEKSVIRSDVSASHLKTRKF